MAADTPHPVLLILLFLVVVPGGDESKKKGARPQEAGERQT